MEDTKLKKPVVALSLAALLAGCAGSHQFGPTTSSDFTTQAPLSHASSPGAPDLCRHVGVISATPCQVKFTSAGSQDVTIAVKGHMRGTVTQHNNCGGSSGVASISRVSNLDWKVTAGSTNGTCRVRFNFYHDGNNEGFAIVRIDNAT